MNAECIPDFFDKFKKICGIYGIQKEGIWNMDEIGLRVGVGRGQWIIVPTDKATDNRFKNIIGSLSGEYRAYFYRGGYFRRQHYNCSFDYY
jgi:hypothetical protein